MNVSKFYIKRRKDEQYYFYLNSANNRTILVSEGYATKQNCMNGINSVKVNAVDEERYSVSKTASGEQWYFVLKALNNQTIGKSEMYNSEEAMQNGIEAVKRDASQAPVVEDLDVQRQVRN